MTGVSDHKVDHIRLVEKKLLGDSREWQTGLQLLFALLQQFQEHLEWEEHFKTIFLRLMVILDDPKSTQKVLVLRLVREILKHKGQSVKDYAEMTTMKVLKCYAHQDALVSAHTHTHMFIASCCCGTYLYRYLSVWFVCIIIIYLEH